MITVKVPLNQSLLGGDAYELGMINLGLEIAVTLAEVSLILLLLQGCGVAWHQIVIFY